MLASPGHSPRHILPPSPSSTDGNAVVASTSTSGRTLMGPPPPKKPKKQQLVIDEDTYVAAIEKMIERDFFPDIPKLQNKLEWLEAVRSGDPVVIREAQININQRLKETAARAKQLSTPAFSFAGTPGSVLPSPAFNSTASVATPSSVRSEIPPATLAPDSSSSAEENNNGIYLDTSLSLDEFLKRYTSEDNDSFGKIIEKVNKRKQEKYGFLKEKEDEEQKDEDIIRLTDGYGSTGQTLSTLDTWKYKAKNVLMYDSAEREDAPLTEKEKEDKLHGPPKSINAAATRFHGKMFDSKTRDSSAISILYTPQHPQSPWQSIDGKKRYDLEELRGVEEEGQQKKKGGGGKGGYSYVATPSPSPGGVEGSPFVTWGEVEGTPLRLEDEDTPVGIGDGGGGGSHFKIPAPPLRDSRAHTLSRDAARSLREKAIMRNRRQQQQQQNEVFYSPSASMSVGSPLGGGGGGASPRVGGGFSAAAQRFVSKAMAKSSGSVDAKLRESYGGGTPVRSSSSGRRSPFVREGSIVRSPSASPAPLTFE